MPKLVIAAVRVLFPALAFAAFAAFAPLAACDAGGDQPPVYDCTTTADCPSGLVCEFPVPGGCGAQGQCGAAPATTCAPEPLCSCTGTTISACVVGGYSTSVASSAGGCGGDGGGADAGGATPEAGSDAGGG